MNIWVLYTLPVMNNAAINICVQVFMWIYVFISLGEAAGCEVAGLYGKCMFNFLRKCLFSKWLYHLHICQQLMKVLVGINLLKVFWSHSLGRMRAKLWMNLVCGQVYLLSLLSNKWGSVAMFTKVEGKWDNPTSILWTNTVLIFVLLLMLFVLNLSFFLNWDNWHTMY